MPVRAAYDPALGEPTVVGRQEGRRGLREPHACAGPVVPQPRGAQVGEEVPHVESPVGEAELVEVDEEDRPGAEQQLAGLVRAVSGPQAVTGQGLQRLVE